MTIRYFKRPPTNSEDYFIVRVDAACCFDKRKSVSGSKRGARGLKEEWKFLEVLIKGLQKRLDATWKKGSQEGGKRR
jgi:hypothetical protein